MKHGGDESALITDRMEKILFFAFGIVSHQNEMMEKWDDGEMFGA